MKSEIFACYDFEAYQRDFREGIDQVEELDSEEGTFWNKMHVPVSFSVGCNLEKGGNGICLE